MSESLYSISAKIHYPGKSYEFSPLVEFARICYKDGAPRDNGFQYKFFGAQTDGYVSVTVRGAHSDDPFASAGDHTRELELSLSMSALSDIFVDAMEQGRAQLSGPQIASLLRGVASKIDPNSEEQNQ